MTRAMKTYLLALAVAVMLVACDDEEVATSMGTVTVALELDDDVRCDSIEVTLVDSYRTTYKARTDAEGEAVFVLSPGFYTAQASTRVESEGTISVYNGLNSSIVVSDQTSQRYTIAMEQSTVNQLVIKELYVGGCQKDDGSGAFYYDKYVTLYNNSDLEATVTDLGLACCLPYNGNATNGFYGDDGTLTYASDDWIPLSSIAWYFEGTISIEPYGQIVIALNNALDCTATYSQSVDLSQADYVTYDPDVTTHTSMHPTPSALIPTDHYFTGVMVSQGTGWALSNTSPAFVVFSIAPDDLRALVNDEDNEVYMGSTSQANKCFKLKRSAVIDAIEVFDPDLASSNRKRLTPDLDAGSASLTSKQGHTSYRNVDEDATTALAENDGLLVRGYMDNADAIDAELSLANGAHIIYSDTNNSTADFHERPTAALRK